MRAVLDIIRRPETLSSSIVTFAEQRVEVLQNEGFIFRFSRVTHLFLQFLSKDFRPQSLRAVANRLSKSFTVPKHLPDGFAIGIKAVMVTLCPSGFQFGAGDVPVRTAFSQHRAQVLPKLFDGRSAKKPVAVIDLEYDQPWFENDDMRDHWIVLRVRVLGDVEVLLNLASRIG